MILSSVKVLWVHGAHAHFSLPPLSFPSNYPSLPPLITRFSLIPQDPSYPLVMYQLLQECWQHELYNRPTAASLKRGLEVSTGLAPDGRQHSGVSSPLLDTLVLPPGQKVVASCMWQDDADFKVGVALTNAKDAVGARGKVLVVGHQGMVDLRLQLYPEVG